MVDQKPLPALPVPAALSIDARQHRGHLLRQFLSEIHEPGIESRREGWAYVLEEVLDELGQCLSQGKWLEGVRKWRERQRETKKREREREIERELKRQDTIKAKKSAKAQDEGEIVKQADSAEGSLTSSKELPPKPAVAPRTGEKHLLLCAAPPGSQILPPSEDSGFDIVPANIGCSFLPGTYSLQHPETSTILFGSGEASTAQTVGGTFSFKGVTSPIQHEHLFRVLRLAIYVHLALTLEQHLLVDSNIALTYPRPKLPPPCPSAPGHSSATISTTDQKAKKHATTSFLPPGLLSFFSAKSSLGHRSSTIMPLGRDLGLQPAPTTPPRPSLEFGGGVGLGSTFRFSILGSAMKKPTPPPVVESRPPFTQALEQIQAGAGMLSTSPGVRFDPPPLIVELAAREKGRARRLKGDERAGLASILGWEGKENLGKGMTGTAGFVRQQGIELLESRHVPGEGEAEGSTVCGRAVWKTYRYYAGEEEDESLGAILEELVSGAPKACEVVGCKCIRGLHETRLVHGGVKVSIAVEERKEEWERDDRKVEVWESCATCAAQSVRREMSDGTYVLSFGKFLELLIYSPTLGAPSPALCAHTERYTFRRHFGTRTHTVTFACSRVEDIFELRVPRLQITRGERCSRDSMSSVGQASGDESVEEGEEERERRELRKEIKWWWEGVADHMDKLEAVFADDDDETDVFVKSKLKALPRLPSTDDDYVDDDPPEPEEAHVTGLPHIPTTPPRPANPLPSDNSIFETPPGAPAPPPPTPAHQTSCTGIRQQSEEEQVQPQPQPSVRLSSLRQTFHRTEQSLYTQLSRTRGAALNDVRRSFVAAARGAEKRLCAWQKKHLIDNKTSKDGGNESMKWTGAKEPEWWKTGCHALPGSNIIVREDDWGSVIAFTLSTPDYQRELAHLAAARQASITHQAAVLPQPPPMESPALSTHSNQSSLFSAAMNYKLFTSSALTQPDPDLDDVTWSEPELFSAVVSRKEHPRDPATSILSIREVLRQGQKSPLPDPSRFGSLGRGPAPPLAWAKPDVQVSRNEADGVVSAEGSEAAGKILQEFESAAAGEPVARPSIPVSPASESVLSLTPTPTILLPPVETNVYKGKASSVTSTESEATIGKENGKEAEGSSLKVPPPPPLPPPKDGRSMPRDQERPRDVSSVTATTSSFASTLTSGLNNAMRFMLHSNAGSVGGGGFGGDASRPASPASKAHHGLLLGSLDGAAAGIDERPHIKYDWTIGKRLKFSCTVYYAKQFDLLRRRCAVDEVYLRSLQRSANWAAEGGKSRSNFWKTGDDRFIIKTLLDAWNVADLQVLIDLAPSYFRYMDATANKATVLAKMMGFYTIEIRNLETGAVQSKADLLVMENLFYDQKVAKTFDLKGIQGRKVKPSSGGKVAHNPKTLFDGEWIEGQQKALVLVRPHSKQVLRAAVRSDAEFLAKSNIMDYSLLVGVDEERKQIVCGLVDTIGSYTFAKTLEYKAKHGLNAGKDITVIPPAEYQERFVSALEGYFLACPDKWSKPVDESKIVTDAILLPSVL
ncbi:hypothetical protein D9615_008619 [Tricholomella constricta]|uniref:PIPK domain-containing protein n=1 Tax=Tricholomella constricta TaxID=117010 RepID=A0A8H5M0K6_9AGAR|nr:hypothetical protein D9615_008619 [Tricholomella constricta]